MKRFIGLHGLRLGLRSAMLAIAAFALVTMARPGARQAALAQTVMPSSTASGALPDLTTGPPTITIEDTSDCTRWNQLGTRARFSNQGTAAAGPFTVLINGAERQVAGLAAGASISIWVPGYTMNPSVTADSTNVVVESNESNNTFSGPVPIPTSIRPCTPTATTGTSTATPTATRTSTSAPLVNLALNKPATGSSACNSSETPPKAVDGTTANNSKFCSLVSGTKFLRVDLGTTATVARFVLKHAGAGGETTSWNTRDFSIQISLDGSTWTTVVNIVGNTASTTSHSITARTARYVRLNITAGEQSGNTARIYELEVYGAGGPTPTRTATRPSTTAVTATRTRTRTATINSQPTPVPPPAGAIVLFDGSSTIYQSEWRDDSSGGAPQWRLVAGGAMEIAAGTGDIRTVRTFTNFKLHVEIKLPKYPPDVTGQARANSGIYLQERYEIQVLDSYGLTTLGTGDMTAIYGQRAPSSNAARPPEVWQTVDITFTAARFDSAGNKIANARVTVQWNGVTVHNDVAIAGPTGGGDAETRSPGSIRLQDHGNPNQFRNIWIQPLP